jgi:molybdate transport system substrate-binding protein
MDSLLGPKRTAAALAALAGVCCGCHRKADAASKQPIHVAAASSLTFAFEEAAAQYEKQTGRKVLVSFGASGLLSRQVREGAPFDLFAAADESSVDDAVRSGVCDGSTERIYAVGRVVMWTPDAKSTPAAVADLADAARFSKIAIANPEHAPYGKAAREALQKAGVWPAVQARIVYGENIEQTLQFAQSGNADVALVALSLAKVSGGGFTLVDDALHAPIRQMMVACKQGAGEDAGKAFEAFLSGAEGRAILRKYGFYLPGEVPTSSR